MRDTKKILVVRFPAILEYELQRQCVANMRFSWTEQRPHAWALTPGVGPLWISIGRLSGVGALWDCVPRVCGGEGGCAGDGVPLRDVPALSWCGEVSRGETSSLGDIRECGRSKGFPIYIYIYMHTCIYIYNI